MPLRVVRGGARKWGGGEDFKRWILLRLAYVLTGMMQKRRTTGGGDKEGVNEEPSPFKGWRNGIPEILPFERQVNFIVKNTAILGER